MKSFNTLFSLVTLTITLVLPITLADHFYTTDPHGELAPGAGYHLEGIACYVTPSALPFTIPMYRWYNSGQGVHFYTTAFSGELAPSLGYDYEGIAYYLFSNEVSGSVPYYRWSGDGHFYSTDAEEGDLPGFEFEGVVGYVYPEEVSGWEPLYRWYNNK